MAQIDKYKKVSFNGGTILGLIVTFVIIFGLIFLMVPTEKERIFAEYNAVSGNTLTTPNHNLNEVSLKKLGRKISKMDKDEFIVVYYGASSCSSCLSNIGSIVDKTKNTLKLDEIYYLDSANVDTAELRDVLGNDTIGDKTPEVWVFYGGELLVSTSDYFNEENGIKWDSFWLRVEHEMLVDKK